jgi:small subunit ribosomal protein S1
VVKLGDEIEVKILRVDVGERKVGLSRKQVGKPDEEIAEAAVDAGTKPAKPRERELRGGTGSGTGQLFSIPAKEEETPPEPEATE